MLPQMIHQDGISKWRSVSFGGIVHTLSAGNGDIWDDRNIVSDDAPVLRTRRAEHRITPNFYGTRGCFQIGPGENDRIEIGGSRFKYKGFTLTDAFGGTDVVQTLTPFNRFALMMPAKRWVRTDVVAVVAGHNDLPNFSATEHIGDVYCVDHETSTGHGEDANCYSWTGQEWVWVSKLFGMIEATWNPTGTSPSRMDVIITDGEYAGVPAEANTITSYNGDFTAFFSPGDGLTLSGAAFPTTRTLVVREVYPRKLVFYEHSFDNEMTSTRTPAVIERLMPDMDQICVNENRVWGYRGKTIYASKLGDFKNWNVFDGLASDSYAVEVLGEGELTGCVSYLGYPIFFKPEAIYKVFGNRPSNFEVTASASTGAVNNRTIAVANETLYYLSKVGVMAYTGGMPQPVSEVLGDIITASEDAQAFSDTYKYMLWYGSTSELLVYDPRRAVWHRQKIEGWGNDTISYAWKSYNGAAFVSSGNRLWARQSAGTLETVNASVEFADIDLETFESKYPVRLWLRMTNAAPVTIEVSYNGGAFEPALTIAAHAKRARYFPLPIRRCDYFRLRISTAGAWTLYVMEVETRREQTNRKGG